MRHLKSDVSHRIKRRPSIFTAIWFRTVLGLGVVVILGLLVGPPVAGWLRGETRPAPRALRPAPPPAKPPEPPRAEPSLTVAAAKPEPPAPAGPPANGTPGSETAAPAPAQPAPDPAAPAAPEGPAAKPPGPGVYRIQLGAFLDHRNADRLIERLRSEGVEVVNSVVEESRTLYRVLATPGDGEGYPALVQRLRALGFTPELSDDGAAVARPGPLRAAVETSRRLRDQGIRVRLERQVSSATFRVVRVGAYATADEAERARAELVGRGYEGFVVRETR